jgi:uncharacterized protein with HEPN domain
MAGMRDIIVHEYDQLDFEMIWDVVNSRLSELLELIDRLQWRNAIGFAISGSVGL